MASDDERLIGAADWTHRRAFELPGFDFVQA
jgi:hypothetical protein